MNYKIEDLEKLEYEQIKMLLINVRTKKNGAVFLEWFNRHFNNDAKEMIRKIIHPLDIKTRRRLRKIFEL